MKAYIPERVVTNQDLEALTGMPADVIESRTGLIERRYAAADETPTDMGVKAALQVFQEMNIPRSEIDLVISACISRDQYLPTDAMIYAHKLGLPRVRCLDINEACVSYLSALEVTNLYIKSKSVRNVLILTSEKSSSVLNYKDPGASVIFGDCAAATLITPSDDGASRIEYSYLETNALGKAIDLVEVKGGGLKHLPNDPTTTPEMNLFHMRGHEIFRLALQNMPRLVETVLKGAGLSMKDIDYIIPHQVNPRTLLAIVNRAMKNSRFPADRVHMDRLLGNTAAATFPTALAQAVASSLIKRGDRVMLIGGGVGFTIAGVILTY
ncbi:MAG: ketoacyl-ACP synthase III [Dehalococcoidia bacterium]|nr:ketoacyl-ACP synthase III [Dehalococcoidia bacterium]